jgi:hypothetical protein
MGKWSDMSEIMIEADSSLAQFVQKILSINEWVLPVIRVGLVIAGR